MDENNNIDPKLTETFKGLWDNLTDEQREKAKKCKTPEELALLAGKEGVELPDELLDAVAGGYIYEFDEWYGHQWWAYDDKGGRHFKASSREEAEAIARSHNWSTKKLSKAELYWIQIKNGNC